ncbi:MAG TPA: serine/threonine-protein kinase [Bryobacteraceae bacterium]|jgi:serine/threonine protein kinase|nr:serine/threonine-protein kinase [Bryobacteraceae bacterium]
MDAETLVREIIARETCLANYELEGELGRGGMGAVFRVRDRRAGTERALKIVLPESAQRPLVRTFFAREMQNALALDHPHIVKSFAAGVSSETPYLLMEYCSGGSVDMLMTKMGRPVPLDQAVTITLEVLDALEYAHTAEIREVKLSDGTTATAHGLVHRDIKPQNIFLAEAAGRTTAKLGDYGLSKAYELAGLSGLTTRGVGVRGTLPFMPRKQLGNPLGAGPEVDIWAVAATLYAMLTGETPRDFTAKADVSPDAYPYYIVQETLPVPIRFREPGVPARIAELLDRALNDEDDLAFQTASQFRQELQAALE